jgi:hypothetical protein
MASEAATAHIRLERSTPKILIGASGVKLAVFGINLFSLGEFKRGVLVKHAFNSLSRALLQVLILN